MKCSKHQEKDAGGICAYSGKPFCADCLVEVEGKMYGKDYLGKVMAEMKESNKPQNPNPMVFMNAGGGGGGGGGSAPTKKPFPHTLHLILTICTCGGWAIVWILHYIFRDKNAYQ
jgi:hypothetical protein